MSAVEVRDRRDAGWFYLDNEVIDDYASKMKPLALACYVYLCRRANADQKAWPSQRTIAEDLGVARNSLKSAIKELAVLKLIRLEIRRNDDGSHQSTVYTLLKVPKHDSGGGSKIDQGVGQQMSQGGSTDEPEEDSLKKTQEKKINAKASESSLAAEGWHFEEYLRDALQAADVPLTRSKARRYTGEANKLLKEGVEELELYEACDRVISEWDRVRLSLDDALRDLRNGGQSNGTKPSESFAKQSGTPQALIEYIFANTRNSAIRNNEARIRSALESFDFTSGESVPYPIEKLLGGNDLEVHSVREGIRSLANRYRRSLEAV